MSDTTTTPYTAIYSRKYRGETKTETVTVRIDRADDAEVQILRANGDTMWVHRNRISFPAPETLALDYAGRCDGCGNDAVELCTWLEDDGGSGQRLRYCRPCMGDDADDPSNEWTIGESIA